MQQVEENNTKHIGSSVAYLRLPLRSSTKLTDLNDYCHLFESRAQL